MNKNEPSIKSKFSKVRSHAILVFILLVFHSSAGYGESCADNTIKLKNRTISPWKGVSAPLLDLVAEAARYPVYGIVQLKHPLRIGDRHKLEIAGIKLLDYLGGTAFYAAFAENAALKHLPEEICWAGPILAIDKIEPDLLKGKISDWAKARSGRIKVIISFFSGVNPKEAEDALSGHVRVYRPFGPSNQWAAEISLQRLSELAKEAPVRWIEQGPLPMMPLD